MSSQLNAMTSMRPKHVLMLSPDCYMIGRRILQEARSLLGQGYRVTLLSGFESPREGHYVQDGIEIHRYQSAPHSGVVGQRSLVAYFGLVARPVTETRAMVLSPLILQFAASTAFTERPTLSSAGRENFERRFFPAVYGFATKGEFMTYQSSEAEKARADQRLVYRKRSDT